MTTLHPLMEFGARQSEAIACLRKNGHKQTTLVLLFAAIDQLAWLADENEAVGNKGFKAWVQRYMIDKNPDHLSGATAADLWGARCGILHTGAAESDESRKGNARRIFYVSNLRQVKSNDPAVLILSLESLGSAFAAAQLWFLDDLEADTEKDARALKACTHAGRSITVIAEEKVVMEIRDTEVLLNLKTGEVRRNVIGPDQRFRFHEGFTEADQDAGWKQISTFSADYPEDEIAASIEQAKAIYLTLVQTKLRRFWTRPVSLTTQGCASASANVLIDREKQT